MDADSPEYDAERDHDERAIEEAAEGDPFARRPVGPAYPVPTVTCEVCEGHHTRTDAGGTLLCVTCGLAIGRA
ncbi:MAG: hypothetical protein ACHQ2Y_04345 [Candidatus Lutacidiplasmatales archaeon]